MKSDGNILIDTKINSDGMTRGIGEIKSSFSKLSGTVKKIGGLIFAAFAAKQVIQFGKECMKLGSDLMEVQNVVDVTFPNMTKQIDDFARSAADSFGLSETMAKKYVGTFGSMAKSFGYSESASYDMATALTGLTGDVASFYNMSQDEAYTKLKSVFTGETESLKELGVVMTQNALDQYALANGFGKTTNKMTEQEKVALRLKFVQNQLSSASGDFARTSDSWANQTRIFELRIQSLKATIGQGLINLFNPILKSINIFLEKLSVATTAFKNFTETVMGKKTASNGMSQAVGDISKLEEGYEGAAAGAENFADGVSDSGKEVKKTQAPFDTLIQIQEKSTENSEDSGELGGIIPPEISSNESQQAESPLLNNALGMLENIKERLLEIGRLFQSGFWEGLGNYKPILSEIIKDFQSIGTHLKDIFTDSDVMAAAKRFVDSFSNTIGKLIGSIASVGLTIATNLVGGMEIYLSNNTERIKSWIVRMFDIGTEINTILGNFFVAFADVFSVFSSQTAQDITGSIIQIFSDIFGGVLEITLRFVRDVLDTILTPFIENKDRIKTAISETLEPIKIVVSSIANTIRKFVDGVIKLYDEHLHPFFISVRDGFTEIWKKILDGYNEYIVPVLDKLAAKFEEVMKGPVGDAIDSALKFIGKLIDAVKELWEKAFLPFITWVIDTIIPILAPIIETIGTVFLDIFGGIAEVVSSVFDILSGLIDFIMGVFTGDWKRAWNGIKEIFSGIWDGLLSIVETVIKGIEALVGGMVKTVTEAFNKITGKSKDINTNTSGGGRTFSVERTYPQVLAYAAVPYNPPMLASGTVVPPRAGISYFGIGDNNHEPEVISPQSTIEQALENVLSRRGMNQEIVLKFSGSLSQLARLLKPEIEEETKRIGVRMVTEGGL